MPKKPLSYDLQTAQEAVQRLIAEDPIFAIGEAEIRGNIYKVFKNAPPTLAGVFMRGASHGDKTFLVYEDERLSFMEVFQRACRLANALEAELNIKKGDRVAIAMRNFPEWCISYMAIIMLGAVVVPLNAWWKSEEFEYALRDCEAKLVIVDAKRLSYLAPLREELNLTLILAREKAEGADYHYDDLLQNCDNMNMPQPENLHTDDDFCILYTSGSTGKPKGVILTHRGCLSTLLSWALYASGVRDARGGVPLFGDDPGILLCIPLFHVTGSHSIFLMSLIIGRRIAMMYRWDPDEALAIIEREKIHSFLGVPSQSYALIEAAKESPPDSLRELGSGGAKRPSDQVTKLTDAFPRATPSSGYGLSETNANGCVISLNQYLDRPSSTGQVTPGVNEIKIMNVDGDMPYPQPVGQIGEIWIFSPSNFRGYLNMPEETAAALTEDGWFRTGDLGCLDEDGFLYIHDRMKDIIIRGGENVSCLEVENRAYAFDDVGEAVVFSVPDDILGERVGLVVFPKSDCEIDAEALRLFIADELAAFKVPEHIWISPQKLPRLGTEKFDKMLISKIARQNKPSLKVV